MELSVAKQNLLKLANTSNDDVEFLLCEILKTGRGNLNTIKSISNREYLLAKKGAKKLGKGMPLSQVIGYVPFLEQTIFVNRNVLSPRPETEELADLLVKQILTKSQDGQKKLKVLDLCCGSGAIAIGVANKTAAQVTAADISRAAIKTTKYNAKYNKAKIKTIKSNMLSKVWGHFDYIICNPPYIAIGDSRVQQNVLKYEPHIALFACEDGLAFYTYLANYIGAYMLSGSMLLLEVGDGQAEIVAKKFAAFANVEIKKDIYGKQRFVIVTK